MPASTPTFGITLANLGPAPTALTPSPGCPSTYVHIASAASPWYQLYNEHCYANGAQCWAEPVDPTLKEKWEKGLGNIVEYFSPGVECPSGWKTVGAMAKPTKGPVTSSGLLTEPPRTSTDIPIVYPYMDALSLLLDPGETVVACCPSSMTVGENGACYSVLSDHPVSTACYYLVEGFEHDDYETTVNATYPIAGTMTSGQLIMPPTATAETTSIMSFTFDASETADYVSISAWGPVFLIHQATDNAAPGRYSTDTSGSWNPLAGMMGALAMSIVAGMAMVLPW